jgi:Cu/Ag efflux protein CusF
LTFAAALFCGGLALEHGATSGVFFGHGMVKAIQAGTGVLTIAHDDIKGFMPAMKMMYKVKSTELGKGVRPGDVIDFRIDALRYEIVEVTIVWPGKQP